MIEETAATEESQEEQLPAVQLEPRLKLVPQQVAAQPIAAPTINHVLAPAAYQHIGEVTLTDDEVAGLREPIPSDQVEIRTDGQVYVSHEYIRRRLLEVLGPMRWTLIPGSPLAQRPGSDPPEYFQRWVLFIKGVYCSEAIASRPLLTKRVGGGDDDERLGYMSLDDVAEAIKSDCLRRCAKDLGLGLEAWNRAWRENWMQEWATTSVNFKGKTIWQRKDAKPPRQAAQAPAAKCPGCGHGLMVSQFNADELYCNAKRGGCGKKFLKAELEAKIKPSQPESIAPKGDSANSPAPAATKSVADPKGLSDKPGESSMVRTTRGAENRPSASQPAVKKTTAVQDETGQLKAPQINLLVACLKGAGLIDRETEDATQAIGFITTKFNQELAYDDAKSSMENLRALLGGLRRTPVELTQLVNEVKAYKGPEQPEDDDIS